MNKKRFNDLLIAMILCENGISDLLFIPGRLPQMSCYGKLRSYTSDLIAEPVTTEMTAQLSDVLIDGMSWSRKTTARTARAIAVIPCRV